MVFLGVCIRKQRFVDSLTKINTNSMIYGRAGLVAWAGLVMSAFGTLWWSKEIMNMTHHILRVFVVKGVSYKGGELAYAYIYIYIYLFLFVSFFRFFLFYNYFRFVRSSWISCYRRSTSFFDRYWSHITTLPVRFWMILAPY